MCPGSRLHRGHSHVCHVRRVQEQGRLPLRLPENVQELCGLQRQERPGMDSLVKFSLSSFGRISSNLTEFASEIWTNLPKYDSNKV